MQLPHIAESLGHLSLDQCAKERRQRERSKNSYDRNDDKKLNEGESTRAGFHMAEGVSNFMNQAAKLVNFFHEPSVKFPTLTANLLPFVKLKRDKIHGCFGEGC